MAKPTGSAKTTDERYAFTGGTARYSDEAAILVCRTNLSGQSLWFKQFHQAGNDDACGTDILQSSDENLVVCGFQGDTSVMAKLSLDGDSLWMKRYEGFPSRLYSLNNAKMKDLLPVGQYPTVFRQLGSLPDEDRFGREPGMDKNHRGKQ